MKWLLIFIALAVISIDAEEDVKYAAGDAVADAAIGAVKDAADDSAIVEVSGADPMSVSGENDDVAALADSNQNLGPRGEDPKEVEADDGAKSGKPLKIRSVRLEKSVRLPKLDGIIKEFNRLVKDSGSIFSSASKAIDRAQADADQQIDRRFKESNKSLNRIKDANKRNDLAKKLTTEVDEARASIRKFLDQQKATIEKVMTADNLYEDGVKLIEKAKQTQTSIFEKLAAMGPKMSSTIQSSFAKASSVMDEIAKK